MKTPKELIKQLIEAIEPMKVVPAKTKAEKFVNVGIEAVKRLISDNEKILVDNIEEYADQFRPKWIAVTERLPEDGGRYWCYVIEINDLGKSGFQWNCYFDDRDKQFRDNHQYMNVTHWKHLDKNPE